MGEEDAAAETRAGAARIDRPTFRSSRGRAVGALAEDFIALTKAHSMLLILLASCKQTLLVLDASGNVLDQDMTDDLRRMIARSENELEGLTARLNEGRP